MVAFQKSLELGLASKNQALSFEQVLSKEQVHEVLHLCADYLYEVGLTQSSDLAKNCIPVHMHLQPLLKDYLALDSFITIGDKYWKDYVYCEMSYESIQEELRNPDIGASLKAHIWLTLADGSVLDCTGEAHMDLLLNRGNHPAHKCLVYHSPDESIPDGYYRPFLVGSEFLIRTGAFSIVPA